MKIPISWGHSAVLPVRPSRILLDGGPKLRGSERAAGPGSTTLHGQGNINPDQNAANIENDGSEFWRGHDLLNQGIDGGRPGRAMRGLSRTEQTNDGRKNRNKDDYANHKMNVLADVRDEMPQRVPAQDRSANPADTANNIEEQITRIRHLCGARDRRAERSHDGHEARE